MDDDEAAILDVVHDEYAREILQLVSEEPQSGPELIETIEASKPTIYRRLSRLEDLELVAAQVRPREDGHQRKVFVADVDAVHVQFDDGRVSVDVDRSPDDAVDRFTKLVSELS
ncbi:winged helix-turn-helix domain-containing protein [Halanaeroarchaeum sp. HSR-CO]|uniref:ArsR/SmtB family transcription factor n=1 Tax=Halanaeroarchaeum sp. HSR-CO TaxID=2866382 RepID=UPI00217EABEA|nr:winged helix-turn-helix domain-containing protein [Halanaeroarchaeum sp. HSR-CO]